VKEIRLGLIGFGLRGQLMSQLAVSGFENVRIVAICDQDEGARHKAQTAHPEARVFAAFDAMMDATPMDALLVETPATLHGKFCAGALRRNVHVMGDVPCVESVEQAHQLWQAQEASDAFYMIGANPNMWAFVETAVDLKRKGLLGEPYYAEAEYIHDVRDHFERTPWRATYECIKYCTHSLGPLLRLIDEDLEWASCFDTGSHVTGEEGRHDAMAALFRTRSNVVVRLLVSLINNYPACTHHYRIYGTKGYFERSPAYEPGFVRTRFHSSALYADKRFVEIPVDEMRPEYALNPDVKGHGGADYALLDRFFQAVRSGGPSPIGLREALRMSLPGLYAADSARRGGELTRIEYPWARA